METIDSILHAISGEPKCLLAIVGPTASGKTALALDIAERYKGSIICADSRTVYKGLDIGTAKPNAEERSRVPHYGLDLIAPDERFSAADFQALARGWIAEIRAAGRLPLIVGGTGLYVDGLLYGFRFGDAPTVAERAQLESLSIEQLQARLLARGIELPENSGNKRYLIRALEQGGVNTSRTGLMEGARIIGLNPGIEVITDRIAQRIDEMLSAGLLEEARQLFATYGFEAPAAGAPAYKALRPYFESGMPLTDCLERFALNDRQLAKRQITWFKRNSDVIWHSAAPTIFE